MNLQIVVEHQTPNRKVHKTHLLGGSVPTRQKKKQLNCMLNLNTNIQLNIGKGDIFENGKRTETNHWCYSSPREPMVQVSLNLNTLH